MRDAIRAVPDGSYRFRDVMDGDGLEAFDIPIAVEVTVRGERIGFDFAGTAPQVPGSINVTLNATVAAVGYAVKALLDPEVPNNQGMLDVLEVERRAGHAGQRGVPGPGVVARPYQPADHRRGAGRPRPGAARARRRGGQRRQLDGGVRRHRPAHAAARSSTSRRSAAAWAGGR